MKVLSSIKKYLSRIRVNVCRTERTILVPLTSSLYVPGTLADSENVIVDVGTGFYVEKVRRAHTEVQGSLSEAY